MEINTLYSVILLWCISLGVMCEEDCSIRQTALMDKVSIMLEKIKITTHSTNAQLTWMGIQCQQNSGETNWQCSDGDDRSCYKLVEAEMTHLEANVNCQNLGSNLVSIESEAENKFLVDMIKNLQNDCKQFHTSGRRSDSGWVWGSTGQAFTYTNWALSEPNNGHGLIEDFCGLKIYLKPTVIAWNDLQSSYKCCSICEFVQPL